MPLNAGQVIKNRYRIVRLLGQGGFGAVYRVWDLNLTRPCALKENLETSPQAQQQFQHEAFMLSGLSHPNLPRVTDYFAIPGQGQYLVMDFVEGEDLQDILDHRRGLLPESQVLPWIVQVCDALVYLHAQSPPIIHRDIKPKNIILTPAGKAMLVDFGIAKLYDAHRKTTLGARAVTPGFSPQEQYGSGLTDARSDVYALGATLYTLLTGQEPVESVQRTSTPLVPPRALNPQVSPGMESVILKAMEPAPAQRFQNMSEFKNALGGVTATVSVANPAMLEAYTDAAPVIPQPVGQPASKSFPWKLALGGLAVLVLGVILVGGVALMASSPRQTAQPHDIKSAAITRLSETPVSPLLTTNTLVPPTETRLGNFTPTLPPIPTLKPISIPAPERPTDTPIPDLRPELAMVSDKDGMQLLFVTAGEFLMGTLPEDPQASDDSEKPQHTVYLDAFFIDETEVSNAMYAICVKAGECQPPSQTSYFSDPTVANHPVFWVSWSDAKDYCAWAGRQLPTEAQWEKAARGAEGHTYSWGEGIDRSLANYGGTVNRTTPVDSYPSGASPFGALNMAGNVWEWVADWFDPKYYSYSPASNPTGPDRGDHRVKRGGAWYSDAQSVRAANRDHIGPTYQAKNIGFRCATINP